MISLRFVSLALLVLKTLETEDFCHRFELMDLDSDRDLMSECLDHLVAVGRISRDAAAVSAFDVFSVER